MDSLEVMRTGRRTAVFVTRDGRLVVSSEDTLEERSVNGIPMASKRKEGQREQLLNSVFGIYVLHIDTK